MVRKPLHHFKQIHPKSQGDWDNELKKYVDFAGINPDDDEVKIRQKRDFPWEWKIQLVDGKITDAVDAGRQEAYTRLVEFREGLLQERFDLPKEYVQKKKKILSTLNANSEEEYIDQKFQVFKNIFTEQNKFLKKVYPFVYEVRDLGLY